MRRIPESEKKENAGQDAVASYYDQYTEGYLNTYGDTIQAFRPTRTEELHDYVIKNSGMSNNMRILDAGCGVAGPSCYFATHMEVSIDGITISPEQKRLGELRVRDHSLEKRVRIVEGDFHQLSQHFKPNTHDLVLFLESLGHARDSAAVLEEAWKVMKPDGCIYIKDFFPFDITDSETKAKHRLVIDRINSSYSYNVLNLEQTIRKLRQVGFELLFVKKFDFQDDITARFNFEEMFHIDLFGDMEEFRVAEWLEIKCRKPMNPLF
ncbi:MAG: class I SAM-dependent methyltransferase [Bacteroidetes bacterium]|nr:class I SAM-dependent methyltransferase [Bacteroidota bacterium]